METPFYQIVLEKLGQEVFQGASVLDVGCARFSESKALHSLGARVTGIDTCHREDPPEGITFVHEDFLEWRPKQPFDMLYLSNSALFMPSERVFEKVKSFQAKIIAIRTMYDFPEPNWNADELKKLYFTRPDDWTNFFEPLGYKTIHATMYETETPDMRGRTRKFRFTEYIGSK